MKFGIKIIIGLFVCLMTIGVIASPIIDSYSVRGQTGSKITGKYETVNSYIILRENSYQSSGSAVRVDEIREVISWKTTSGEVVSNNANTVKFVSKGYKQIGRTRTDVMVTVTYNKKSGVMTVSAPGVKSITLATINYR